MLTNASFCVLSVCPQSSFPLLWICLDLVFHDQRSHRCYSEHRNTNGKEEEAKRTKMNESSREEREAFFKQVLCSIYALIGSYNKERRKGKNRQIQVQPQLNTPRHSIRAVDTSLHGVFSTAAPVTCASSTRSGRLSGPVECRDGTNTS